MADKVKNGEEIVDTEKVGEEGEKPAGKGDYQVENAEKPKEEPSEDYAAEIEKRGAKNVIEENKRKSKEVADLKERQRTLEVEIEKIKTAQPAKLEEDTVSEAKKKLPKEIDEYIKSLKEEYGYDDSYIDKHMNAMTSIASNIVDFRLRGTEKVLYKEDLENSISALKSDDKYKYSISKLEKELREEVMKHPGQYWKEKDFLKTLLGTLIADNQDKLFGKREEPAKKGGQAPTDGAIDDASSGGQSGQYTQKELEEYALEMGVSLDNPEIRRKVKESLLMRKRAEKTYNKE